MAEEKKTYTWPVQLRENMVTEDTSDYVASVKTFTVTKTVDDIINELIKRGIEYKKETFRAVFGLMEGMIRETVCSGYPVITDNARYSPTITGSFDSNGDPLGDSEIKCGVNIQPTDTMKKEVAQVRIVVDTTLELGGAKITRVKDLYTGATDGTVHAGDMIEITGNKIKCLNADGSGIGRFTLYNESESGEEITQLGYNDPSRITFMFPTGLLPGSYRLEIETYFAAGSKLLKTPRTLVCPILLKLVE